MALSAVSTQLTVAREHALLGDYSSAVVYYAGVLSQVDRYLIQFTLVLLLPTICFRESPRRTCAGTCRPSRTLICCPNGELARPPYSQNTGWQKAYRKIKTLLLSLQSRPGSWLTGVSRCGSDLLPSLSDYADSPPLRLATTLHNMIKTARVLVQSGETAPTPVKRNSRPTANTVEASSAGYQPEFTIHVVCPTVVITNQTRVPVLNDSSFVGSRCWHSPSRSQIPALLSQHWVHITCT